MDVPSLTRLLAAALALAFPALVIAGAVRDLTSYTIPNWVSLALLAAFPLAALACGLPLQTMAVHAGVGLGALVVCVAVFALRGMGGGDAKLIAAVSLWMGWPALGPFLLVTLVAGGVLSLALLLLRAPALRALLLSGPAWLVRLADPKAGAPYGVAIAFGGLMAFPQTPFMAAFAAAL